jgi:hypothetical protein
MYGKLEPARLELFFNRVGFQKIGFKIKYSHIWENISEISYEKKINNTLLVLLKKNFAASKEFWSSETKKIMLSLLKDQEMPIFES